MNSTFKKALLATALVFAAGSTGNATSWSSVKRATRNGLAKTARFVTQNRKGILIGSAAAIVLVGSGVWFRGTITDLFKNLFMAKTTVEKKVEKTAPKGSVIDRSTKPSLIARARAKINSATSNAKSLLQKSTSAFSRTKDDKK